MRAAVTVLILVLVGVVGAWAGYFLGYALGWTTNAEFPLRIGGGDRAIGLSILVSFGSVMLGTWLLIARPMQRDRRLLERGVVGHATIRRVWRTGFTVNRPVTGREHQLAFELELHPEGEPDVLTRATAMIPDAVEATLLPGVEVVVRVDPDNARVVTVVGPLVRPG